MSNQTAQKPLRKLSKKQLGFAKDYLETGNGKQSALKNYDTNKENVAASIASENLTKPNVRAYLESKAEKAAEFVYELAESSQVDSVRLNASKDILDRTGYKVPETSVNPGQTTTYNFLFSPETQASVKLIEDQIKARLMQSHATEN